MATLIASQAKAGVQPREIHVGVNSVYAVYSLTATLSAGDIIQMCKLPDGARIVNVKLAPAGYLGDAKLNVGTRANHDQFIASATVSGANVQGINAGLGDVLDISDAATTRYTMVEVQVSDDASSSGTNGGALTLLVEYDVDN